MSLSAIVVLGFVAIATVSASFVNEARLATAMCKNTELLGNTNMTSADCVVKSALLVDFASKGI